MNAPRLLVLSLSLALGVRAELAMPGLQFLTEDGVHVETGGAGIFRKFRRGHHVRKLDTS